MTHKPSDLASRLGQHAEAVCRHYLNAGQRQGNYWKVGDVRNTPGSSMYVRLTGTRQRPAGKWQDAATDEHGDLLDVIRESRGITRYADVVEEAQRFLGLRHAAQGRNTLTTPARFPIGTNASEPARRLFAMSQPLDGTIAATYLGRRGVTALNATASLRFHPRCYYRPDDYSPTETWPAMIAAVTDLSGDLTGVHRTWLAPDGFGKAPIDTPRKAMGELAGNAVRFGIACDVMAAGEGIETVLSLREIIPGMAMAAALSSSHLAAILFPDSLRRLYIIQDNDQAGERATEALSARAQAAGITPITLCPQFGDFNDDLQTSGTDAVLAHVRLQLAPQDVARFIIQTA